MFHICGGDKRTRGEGKGGECAGNKIKGSDTKAQRRGDVHHK